MRTSGTLAFGTHTRGTARGAVDRMARRMLLRRLSGLESGAVVISEAGQDTACGAPDTAPAARIAVRRARFFRRVVAGGALGAADAYLDGDWDCDDLAGLFRLFLRNRLATGRVDGGAARLARLATRAWHRARANTPGGSRRNIRDHYDLGNAFFELFLDHSMTYSAGVFATPQTTLEEAQRAKLDRICRKLDLAPGHHVLEIGTGWGSFALHAASRYGCRVTTTTISDAQYERARARVQAEGLEDRITLLRRDYRELEGEYDRIVSIEMIEAVGHEYLDDFFRCCGARLKSDGRMLLQVITTGDQYYERYRHSVDFIQRYVFPGSLCPSLGALIAATGRATDLRVTHVEDLAGDYALTLRHWRRRFLDRANAVRALGYPERFLRLWDYYLQYCEAGFSERHIGDLQIVLARPGDRSPPVRPELRREGAP